MILTVPDLLTKRAQRYIIYTAVGTQTKRVLTANADRKAGDEVT